MTKFDELRERFPNLIPVQELRSNVSIVELALQYGYEPQVHKGRTRPVLEHSAYNDTIIIKNPQDASQQVYQRAGDFTDSGTVIDFIRNRLSTVFSTFNRPGEHEFKNITSVLYDYLQIDPNHVSQNRKTTAELSKESTPKQQFAKEQFDIRPLEKDNYLNQRSIAPQTLVRPEFTAKVVAQVAYFNPATGHTDPFPVAKEHPERNYLQFTNVAFPYYNGLSSDITGLELRNDNVKLHAPGSDRYSSVFISNPPPKTERFYIMESAIDALSHQQLRSIKGDNKFNAVYFSTGGQLTPHQVNTITRYIGSFEKSLDFKIILSFDNDPKGHRYDLLFSQQLAASKFPMSPTVGGLNRYNYLLPEQEAYRPIQEALLSRIGAYNTNLHAQFARTDQDVLGKAELSAQQFVISRSGNQVGISVPDSAAALSSFSKSLLELTGLDQRVEISKSFSKDYNLELIREIELGEKFGFVIKDETGMELLNGNSVVKMGRSFQQFKNQAESEGFTGSFTLFQRADFGFLKPLAALRFELGNCIKSTQIPTLDELIQVEKKQATQLQQVKSEEIPEQFSTRKTGLKPR